MRLEHTHNRLRLSLSHLFYEQVEPRYATKVSIVPVEAGREHIHRGMLIRDY